MASPKPVFRPAGPADADGLIGLYDRHYRGGYSASFDRYGPLTPQAVWWVQSEKAVTLIELDRRPSGLLILGRLGKRLLAEEVLVGALPEDAGAFLRLVHEWLTRRFQAERQDVLALRCDETNAAALTIARTFAFTFTNALLVAGTPPPARDREPVIPAGYHIRRAAAPDGRQITRLHDETLGQSLRPRDVEQLWRQPDTRVLLAERERFPVGFMIAQVRDGAGRWTVGVREGHRRRGLGRALVHPAQQFFQTRGVPSITTYWGTDVVAASFAQALGARIERVYLYFERPL
jgi:GNAT superfamily N-acetyltransferase